MLSDLVNNVRSIIAKSKPNDVYGHHNATQCDLSLLGTGSS